MDEEARRTIEPSPSGYWASVLGTMDLWGMLCFPDSVGLTACDEARHTDHGDHLAGLLSADAPKEG